MPFIKPLPASLFYAVIFSSTKSEDLDGYAEMDEQTLKLAAQQPGYLGYESVNNSERGIFISYWESRDVIDNWRRNATHLLAKAQARKWFKSYLSQICLVESSQIFNN